MSRKAGSDAEQTKEKILEAAAEEFSSAGFKDSSLRNICRRADVTTGAVYCFYENKEALFCEVLGIAEKIINNFLSDHYRAYSDFPSTLKFNEEEDIRGMSEIIRFYHRNKKLCDVILKNRSQKEVISLFSRITDENIKIYMQFIEETELKQNRKIHKDEFAVRCFCTLETEALFALLSEDMSEQEALSHVKSTVKIIEAAFGGLIS